MRVETESASPDPTLFTPPFAQPLMKTLALFALALMLVACDFKVSRPTPSTINVAVNAELTSSTFQCMAGSSGDCNFLLYTKVCEEARSPAVKPRHVCTLEELESFTLPVGGSKSISGLPAGFLQCTLAGGAPKLPDCAK